MANLAKIQTDTIFENETYWARWRFVDAARDSYQNADITSCKYDAFQIEPYSATALASDTALTLQNGDNTPTSGQIGWFDTLQTESDDGGWEDDDDSTGYNCIAQFPGTLFATAGVVRIEVYVVLAGDASTVRCATFDITVLAALGS